MSDPHFTPDGIVESVRGANREFVRTLAGKDDHEFLGVIPGCFESGTTPVAVLVTGDLVAGTNDVAARQASFAKAREFLVDLAAALGIRDLKKIFVVPGNHDADWSTGLHQPDRFSCFFEAMNEFTAPRFDQDGHPEARPIRGAAIAASAQIDLLLMISPTFSGFQFASTSVSHLDDVLGSRNGSFDIAALGARQRRQIGEMGADNADTIRIALLHHHLLPHPEIEAGAFASILDAGPALEHLLRNFDLVLTGHKHTRRLLQLRKGTDHLDIYSAPSLFHGHGGGASGFTVIDVHGPSEPYYATLEFYETAEMKRVSTVNLVRQGRVDRRIEDLCVCLSPAIQSEKLIPILRPAAASLTTTACKTPGPLFDAVWQQLTDDLGELHKGTLVFRPPNLHRRWSTLLDFAKQLPDPKLQLVSSGDMSFWKKSMTPLTDPNYYEKPVREFPRGRKTRILILDRNALRAARQIATAIEVVEEMIGGDITIQIVWMDQVGDAVWKDFGIIAGIAVSRFESRQEDSRTLRESFDDEDIRIAREHWDILSGIVRWNSENRTASFATWLHAELGYVPPQPPAPAPRV